MKNNTLTLFIILGLSLLLSKDESVFLKQVELENIYKFKIESFLEKIYDKSEYYVFADVRLEKKPDATSNNRNSTNTQLEDESSGAEDPFGYTFIEGLGLNPTLPTAPMNSSETKRTQKKEAKNDQEYIMTGLNVSVYLAEDIYSVESRETITNFVNTNIDEIRNCFDCFVLEKMPNHIGRKQDMENMVNETQSVELEKLNKITNDYATLRDSLKWDLVTQQQEDLKHELQRMIDQSEKERDALSAQMNDAMDQKDLELQLTLESKEKELNFLIQQLDDATSARLFWEDQEARRNILQNNLDSLKFINLMSIQEEYRSKQNQLLENITSDYENSIQARINDAKGTEERLFKLIEGKTPGKEDVDIEAYKKNANRTSLYIIIGVAAVALIVLIVFILMKKNKKVVYLKPRETSSNPEASGSIPQPTPPQYTAPPTESNDNTDVVRSEVRSLRQSAVTMSAGQKEGASQIISDWLDESSDSDDTSNEDNSEKE